MRGIQQNRAPVPPLSADERRENLRKAAAARARRSRILDNVRSGALGVSEVFTMADAGDIDVRRTRVFTLLRSVPGFGFAKAQRLMRKLGISESRRVQGLGHNQRALILEEIGRAS